jgi:hypothetical protein
MRTKWKRNQSFLCFCCHKSTGEGGKVGEILKGILVDYICQNNFAQKTTPTNEVLDKFYIIFQVALLNGSVDFDGM